MIDASLVQYAQSHDFLFHSQKKNENTGSTGRYLLVRLLTDIGERLRTEFS
jgi:hypothetical protein